MRGIAPRREPLIRRFAPPSPTRGEGRPSFVKLRSAPNANSWIGFFLSTAAAMTKSPPRLEFVDREIGRPAPRLWRNVPPYLESRPRPPLLKCPLRAKSGHRRPSLELEGEAALQTAFPSCGKAMTEERCRSRPDEREQVGVEDIRMCGQHAMGVARIGLQRPVLKQIDRTRH